MNKEEQYKLNQQQIRMMTKGAYQIQHLRVQTGNRLAGNFKNKLGQQPGKSEKSLEKEAKEILEKLRREYNLITDGVAHFPSAKKFKGTSIIDDYTELCLVGQYVEWKKAEDEQFKRIRKMLELYPIWTEYLKDINGVGEKMASVLISEIDIYKATYPSSLWKLAGLDVAWDNRGRSKRSEHLVDVEYINKKGETDLKKSITFKPFLKTKLMGVLGGCLIKCVGSTYAPMYREYKNRLENHPNHRDNFFAINIEKCKEELGYIPTRIYKRSFITENYNRCQQRIMETSVYKDDDDLRSQVKKLQKSYLGSYEIYEVLLEKGLITECSYQLEDIEMQVKSLKGVLRKPKIKEVFKEEVEEGDETGITEVEEFDDSDDPKGRPVWKLMNLGKSSGHRNQMAIRWMVKRFLVDLYKAWRELEGLPVMPEYSEAVLNMPHKEAVENKGKKVR